MANDVFDFRWRVSEGGHEWVNTRVFKNPGRRHRASPFPSGEPSKEPVWALTDNLAVGSVQYRVKMYTPLTTHTGLYRTFADLDTSDRDSILAFANTYGMLGVGLPTTDPVEIEGTSFLRGPVEEWRRWQNEVLTMRRAVTIQVMVERGDRDGLAQFIRWQGEGCYFRSHESSGGDQPELGYEVLLIDHAENLFRPGDLVTPARFLVQRWINGQLKGNVEPQLRYDVKTARQVMQILPSSLLSCLWLQFAQAVAGGRKHRLCKVCNTWFEISPKGVIKTKDGEGPKRMSRLFCSDPCKTKDYRDRKASALELKAQGKTVAAIAQQLDTPVETIKTWTTKRKGK